VAEGTQTHLRLRHRRKLSGRFHEQCLQPVRSAARPADSQHHGFKSTAAGGTKPESTTSDEQTTEEENLSQQQPRNNFCNFLF
jgi:hypothetical protein